ncbi:GNAT family N-acetyltransferase [Rhodobacteraceae bacterium]|nr:GNAT family N-acetyltransferase [Paracoccaceae bacterium]
MIDFREGAETTDGNTVWSMLEPIFRAGDAYAVNRDVSREAGLQYWFSAKRVYVAKIDGVDVGTFYIRENQQGGGVHVCNAGFVTARGQEGRGISRAMLAHAQIEAKRLQFKAMQFNFVVETNTRAIDIWLRAGFIEIGRQPEAFVHPTLGPIDALILHKFLD